MISVLPDCKSGFNYCMYDVVRDVTCFLYNSVLLVVFLLQELDSSDPLLVYFLRKLISDALGDGSPA